MINLFCKFSITIILIMSFIACSSDYSKYQGEVQLEKNSVSTYNKPYFQKEINALGTSINLGISAGVGFGVYKYAPAKPLNDFFRQNNINLSENATQIIQGVSAGILTYFVNKYIMKDTTITRVTDSNIDQWMDGISKDILKIEFVQNSHIKTISKSAESSFIIENISDAKLFKKMFPKSNFTEDLIVKSYPKLKQFELKELIELYPELKSTDEIQRNVILNSEYLKDFISNINLYQLSFEKIENDRINSKFEYFIKSFEDIKLIKSKLIPQIKNDYLESKAILFIKNMDNIEEFNSIFPNSIKQKNIDEIGFSFINNINDAVKLKIINPNILNYDQFENVAFNQVKTLSDLKIFKERIQKNKKLEDSKDLGYQMIKKTDDLIYFSQLYPNDQLINKAIDKIYDNLSRADIAKLIQNFPFTDKKELLSIKYISTISSMDDAIDAVIKFEEKKSELSKIAYKYCDNVTNYRKFLSYFSESEFAPEIKKKYYENIMKEPENLGSKINSKIAEYCPIITPDGETLYFIRRDKSKSDDNEEIYYSKLEAMDIWGEAKNIGSPLNNKEHNGVNGVSQDGNTLILHNLYDKNTAGISITKKISGGWSLPKSLDIPEFYNNTNYHNACLSTNEKIIMCSLGRNDSYGGNDIYVIFKDKAGNWGKPINVGPMINTDGDESSIFLAADGETVYFSSNGHKGFGGYDIFMSRRLDKTWTYWSEPVNLGSKINTDLDDQFYVIPASGEFVYYSSDKNSIGQSDLYRVGLPEEFRPKPVVLVEGKVINKKDNKKLHTTIIYEDIATGEELGDVRTSPDDSTYKLILTKGKKYGLRADEKGYYSVNENLDLTKLDNFKKMNYDLELVPIEKGQIANINNIFFDFDKFDLKSESFLELNRIVKILNDVPNINIEIAGHTDNKGSDQHNQKLSDNRAKSVVKYLISKGISPQRLVPKGYGSKEPVVPNDSDFNRAKNRRVEIKFI